MSDGRLARANVVEARVKVAHMAALAETGRIVTVGLGSCVAITLWDKARRVGALAHVLLPEPHAGGAVENPAKFATTAVPALEEAMRECGSRGPYVATLTGGASLFGQLLKMRGENVGGRNTAAALAALERANIPVVGSDTGGDYGRTVTLDVADGSVTVRSVSKGTRVL
ncbi:MAG TPA: chemotaxis protein CheD [Gemmatimonadaceae bacterium]|nr:chemotaxis protein CheD [Gemmatimonadaceae bacterium]